MLSLVIKRKKQRATDKLQTWMAEINTPWWSSEISIVRSDASKQVPYKAIVVVKKVMKGNGSRISNFVTRDYRGFWGIWELVIEHE